jgi:PIN domain nuclease of toxin-antitoxin system
VEAVIHLDTHVVAWLWAGDVRPLGRVTAILDREDLVISPMVVLELQYLHEIGRLVDPARDILADLVARIGLRTSDAPFGRIVERSLGLDWTRDPFDRLIVANAIVDGCSLLTRDATIRKHFRGARWGRAKVSR